MDVYNFNTFKKENGFTLVELLVGVVIIAIIIGISIQGYMLIKDRAKEAATETEMSNIAKALEIYVADKDAYPAEDDFPEVLEVAGIMEGVPDVDTWENSYQYSSIADNSYILESYGIDRVDGGDDDIIFTDGVMTEDGAYSN